jgi:hypothetical protein
VRGCWMKCQGERPHPHPPPAPVSKSCGVVVVDGVCSCLVLCRLRNERYNCGCLIHHPGAVAHLSNPGKGFSRQLRIQPTQDDITCCVYAEATISTLLHQVVQVHRGCDRVSLDHQQRRCFALRQPKQCICIPCDVFRNSRKGALGCCLVVWVETIAWQRQPISSLSRQGWARPIDQ